MKVIVSGLVAAALLVSATPSLAQGWHHHWHHHHHQVCGWRHHHHWCHW